MELAPPRTMPVCNCGEQYLNGLFQIIFKSSSKSPKTRNLEVGGIVNTLLFNLVILNYYPGSGMVRGQVAGGGMGLGGLPLQHP